MKDAYAEFQNLRQNWQQVRSKRPGEVDFSPFGFKGAKATDFDALFEEWEQALATAASKTKSVAADDQALEAVIIYIITQLNNSITATTNNGFQWLIQSGFAQRVSELNVALTPVLDRRFRIRKALLEAAAKDVLNNDITKVEAAAPLADALVEQQKAIQQQAAGIEEALTQSKASEQQAEASKNRAQEHLEAIKQAEQEVTTTKSDYDKTVADAHETLVAAKKILDTIAGDRESADKQVAESSNQLEIANKKIMKAIADINRQGLAGAFDDSAKRLGRERIRWMATFSAAIIYLIIVVILNSEAGQTILGFAPNATATLPLWERALHVLPLAAPGIWLGWFAAKNASLTARIQQDYVYKVATAQSFEAYKREVAAADDKALEKQLLETTIRNFGDNPIRIYNGTSVEGHPLEGLKSVLDDKSFNRLLDILKAIKPSVGG